MIRKYNGFILLKFPYKTGSVITNFVTENSIMSAVCYGARKNSKHFGSDLEAIAKLSILVDENNRSNLSTIKETSIIKHYKRLESSFLSSLSFFYVREVIFSIAKDFDNRYFILIEHLLEALEENELKNQDELKVYLNVLMKSFEMKMLYIIGILPSISRCVFCQNDITNLSSNLYFSIDDGGVVCKACKPNINSEYTYKISEKDIDFLLFIKHTSFIDIVHSEKVRKYEYISNGSSKDILKLLILKHIGKGLKTDRVLEEILNYT